jgi:hypothetical protein
MSTFEAANQALREDLAAYAIALRTIVSSLPQVRQQCERILKEVRLAQTLLAFASGPQVNEINHLLFKLRNLWPYREHGYPRTIGFTDEIQEARVLAEEAQHGLRMLARHRHDALSAELITCLTNIISYFEAERQLLQECHDRIQPHAHNMSLTCKRLDLLMAAIDARLPDSPSQKSTLQAYRNAAELLRSWENGVPLDEQGVQILDDCIASLEQADTLLLMYLNPAHQPVHY